MIDKWVRLEEEGIEAIRTFIIGVCYLVLTLLTILLVLIGIGHRLTGAAVTALAGMIELFGARNGRQGRESMTNDEAARVNGFKDAAEYHKLLARVQQLDSPERIKAFKHWQYYDGSKEGLLALIAKQVKEATHD